MKRNKTLKRLSLLCFALSLLMFALSMAGSSGVSDIEKVADKMEARLDKRLEILDHHISKVTETEAGQWPSIGPLPGDMVIYRYVNDSLQSWSNQFSVLNDDISSRLVFERMTDLKNRLTSPLTDITEDLSYMSIGPKWYVVKAVNGTRNDRVIAGLEIKNTLIDDIYGNENGVNPELKLPVQYYVQPLSFSGGTDVSIDGIPLFKVITDTTTGKTLFDNSLLRWIGILLFAISLIISLAQRRTFRAFTIVTSSLAILMGISVIWAHRMNGTINFFSPTIYADGPYMSSVGVLVITNLFITMMLVCCYLIRKRALAFISLDEKKKKASAIIYFTFTAAAAICSLAYAHMSLRSFILNSSISLELYKWNSNIGLALTIYLTYTALLYCTILQFQTLGNILGKKSETILTSTKGIIVFSLLCSLYFTFTAASLGFRKEEDRVVVWANRLAVDRNLALEIQLRSVEDNIAGDQLISALVAMDHTASIIQNRISEHYLSRVRQDNIIEVMLFKDDDLKGIDYFNTVTGAGTPISEGSRFLFLTDGNGHSTYAGAFLFWNEEHGLIRLLLIVEPSSNREDRGYHSILGRFSKPGELNIPSMYSYAKYIGNRLVSYKGNYPYPTISSEFEKKGLEIYDSHVSSSKGYMHFMSLVSEDELIVISRKQRSPLVYFTSMSYLFLTITALLLLTVRKEKKVNLFKRNYFRTRINTILFTSSFLILISMTAISVIFVYKRNETNLFDLMSTKINTIQALTESRIRQAKSWHELMSQETSSILENIGNTTKSDITLYTPEGKVFHSTTPEIFEKQILGSRINEDAYKNIKYSNQRFFIHREKIANYSYWMLYAPLFNDDREMIAILCIPYTERNYDFRREASFHAALIINLFLLLLICSLLFSTNEVNQMFKPLIEMGGKMAKADINNPEYIIYKREDEISSLIDAYNRMVRDLSESTQKLAAAERDKAWSEMARQVAHEIKNPLTPIKLEIQRLIRLKQNGNPLWEEKFDKVSSVVLEHIDILTDTANEFSTFAKLYSEEPVLVDLDKTLKEQLLIFDNKENIRVSYIGMPEAYVMVPKPQLIRVFVNLITNAIQAVEIRQREKLEESGETLKGEIVICLRNSTKDGYYDIVFDDNGPGVKEENQSRLFTPNFTTKSAGTGLGLAICRNIITKCEGEISYRKSYSLGGASFMVTLPKHNA